jgi:hypothetical protein
MGWPPPPSAADRLPPANAATAADRRHRPEAYHAFRHRPDDATPTAGFTGPKQDFMNPRRKHTVEAVRSSIRRSVAMGVTVAAFEIMACHGDGFLPSADTVGLGLAWGGAGTGTLPMSEQEWNWPGYAKWGDELQATLRNRHKHEWTSRVNKVVFRGGARCLFGRGAGGADAVAIPQC